jgi:hypothetical protein
MGGIVGFMTSFGLTMSFRDHGVDARQFHTDANVVGAVD